MSEHVKDLEYQLFGQRLHKTAFRERIPLVGSMAATYRCNLDCKHCYLDGCRDLDEMACDEWLEIIDQIAEAGCLWFLISGGEPLIRRDFEKIYRYAKGKGLLVGVFTNATLIDDSIIDLWRECPPYVVEVSLYGYSRATYAEVTGVPGARDATFDGVHRLAEAAIPTRLKSMLLRQNAAEIDHLKRFSEELGMEFRLDPMVSPGLHGSRRPCATQLDQETILSVESGDKKAQEGWAQFFEWQENPAPRKSLFSCGGGMKFFFIDPSGMLCLCPFDTPLYDVKRGSFLAGWNGPLKQRRNQSLPEDHPCFGCKDGVFCGICPPVARMETGSDLGRPQPLCDLGKRRSRAILSRLGKPTTQPGNPPGE